jgi:hypothetical protein
MINDGQNKSRLSVSHLDYDEAETNESLMLKSSAAGIFFSRPPPPKKNQFFQKKFEKSEVLCRLKLHHAQLNYFVEYTFTNFT